MAEFAATAAAVDAGETVEAEAEAVAVAEGGEEAVDAGEAVAGEAVSGGGAVAGAVATAAGGAVAESQNRLPTGAVRQSHLAVQDLSTLDPSRLTAMSPEVISRQATINVGTIGHVAHGKSTVVKSISGVHTVRFRNELERNITIKLGYAGAKLYRDEAGPVGVPGNYTSRGSAHPDTFADDAGRNWTLQRHVSFVDCPGHDILMATMLNGAAVMDAALLLIAGNETCPQPQTSEHLAAVEIMRLNHIIILQNKVDLVKPEVAQEQQEQIKKFVHGTVAADAPIVPISAVLKYNIDVVCEYLCNRIPVPARDFTSVPRLIVIRSFDVNKPGEEVANLKGGVAGGSILQGVLKIGDEIEVRPGIVTRDSEGRVRCCPILSRIVSLYAEKNDLQFAVPGGLIGVGTQIDPTLTRADRLVGQVLGLRHHLPSVFTEVEISFYLLRRLLGVKTADGSKQSRVHKLQKQEILMVNIGSTATGGKVLAVKQDLAKILLTQPVCTQEGEKIALSRRVDKHWRLIGWGQIRRGSQLEVDDEVPHAAAVGAEVSGAETANATAAQADAADADADAEEAGEGAGDGDNDTDAVAPAAPTGGGEA